MVEAGQINSIQDEVRLNITLQGQWDMAAPSESRPGNFPGCIVQTTGIVGSVTHLGSCGDIGQHALAAGP